MANIYIVSLNQVPFLPYIYGLLRASAEKDPVISKNYLFQEPIFLPDTSENILMKMEKPDVTGFSCYVWNFRKHMKVARLIKEKWPETLIVAGGPHIPDVIEDFFLQHPYVDILVHGEGELTFRDVLRENLKTNPDWSNIPGISYRTSDGKTQTTSRRQSSWTEMLSAYADGYLNNAIKRCQSDNLQFYALWETNRGCPYSCSFCDWGSSTMSKIRRFSEERVFEDVEFFGKSAISNLFICDANFGLLTRDLEITEQLVKVHKKYGYPRQIRVNYAKNSNERVFSISKLLAEHHMQMGTTLSMQSTNIDVLEAINRKNITVKNYQTLNERYSAEGINTYTELILGLPLETKETFIDGLNELLVSGNHNDLRVFDFMILPNAPINNPVLRNSYGLRLTPKPLYFDSVEVPCDETEMADFVFETNTLSRTDWVNCSVFSQAIQILHNGCFTRYLAIHLYQKYQVSYREFYEKLILFFQGRPQTVLGSIFNRLFDLYQSYTGDLQIPYTHLIYSQRDMYEKLLPFGKRRGWTPDNWGWLCIALEHGRFFSELGEFLNSLDISLGEEIEDLSRFQNDIILQLNYDPKRGKTCHYDYDFPGYFHGKDELTRRPVTIHFCDTHLGSNYQYEIEFEDPRKFAKAAIGVSYPFVRVNHYQHQLTKAIISYDSNLPMVNDEIYENKHQRHLSFPG